MKPEIIGTCFCWNEPASARKARLAIQRHNQEKAEVAFRGGEKRVVGREIRYYFGNVFGIVGLKGNVLWFEDRGKEGVFSIEKKPEKII